MQIRIKSKFVLLMAMLVVSTFGSIAQAQTGFKSGKSNRPEFAVEYTYMHSNAPPGGCGCFNLNGGSGTFAWPIKGGPFALVVDATVGHAGHISSNNYNLTLATYTAGGRYTPRFSKWGLHPYGQVLVGAGHSSGSLVAGQNSSASNADAAFAGQVGGGLDLHLRTRFSIRVIEADYVATTFNNGDNDHQNNLRLSTGVVFHF